MVEVIFKPFLELKCPQIETSPVAKSEEKWLFLQDTFTHAGASACILGFQVRCIFSPTSWCNAWVLHNFASIFLFFILFLCKFQVISQQAEQEQAELEVKTTKHEIFKVTFSPYIILN